MKTDEKIRQECLDSGLGHWQTGICQNPECAGDGIVEDTFDGFCRSCSCGEERPTDPAEIAPPLRASTEEWQAWLFGSIERSMLEDFHSEVIQ